MLFWTLVSAVCLTVSAAVFTRLHSDERNYGEAVAAAFTILAIFAWISAAFALWALIT